MLRPKQKTMPVGAPRGVMRRNRSTATPGKKARHRKSATLHGHHPPKYERQTNRLVVRSQPTSTIASVRALSSQACFTAYLVPLHVFIDRFGGLGDQRPGVFLCLTVTLRCDCGTRRSVSHALF